MNIEIQFFADLRDIPQEAFEDGNYEQTMDAIHDAIEELAEKLGGRVHDIEIK